MKMLLHTVSYCGILLLPFLFMTCSKDDEPTGPAQIMFVNGLTDGHMSTVIVADSTIVALTAGFGNPTAYNEINSGNQKFELKDNVTGSIVTSKNLSISAGKNYTLMAAGNTTNAELVIKEDDLSFPDTTKAYIRLINLSPNSQAMTMSITAGADLATNVTFKSVSDFTGVLPAKYNITIKSGNTVISTIANFNLPVKRKYSILITGLVNQNPAASYNFILNK